MKKIFFSLLLCCFFAACSKGQQQTFDITSYTAPKNWKKQTADGGLQFSIQDEAKGTYCIITLYKAIPTNADSKTNFDAAWETVVKEMVTVSAAPEMQAPSTEDGWEVQSGYASFESNGEKGVAVLVTSTGNQKMVNILILTNTDVYEKDISGFLESIVIKKTSTALNKPTVNTSKPTQPATTAKQDGFTFTTTNFDDGWTSVVQEDWVEVTKENMKVLLHYPKEGTIFPADPEPLTNAAWNILVAPRYSNLRNYKTTYISSYNRVYVSFGSATENATGKEVYIVFYRQGQTGWVEFVSPDKNSFIQYFKVDPEIIRWDTETSLLDLMVKMPTYNKFAIGASDFKGTWTSDFTGVQQLYNVYTGNYAGMNVHQSNQTFQFGAGSTYNWSLMAVNGTVGNTKYVNVKSSGKFSVLNNWQINFSDIEGKSKKYNAYFACIKGARLLMLLDAVSPGTGIYDAYGKK